VTVERAGSRGSRRKAEHIEIASAQGVEHRAGTGLERFRLRHRALPGRDLAAVTLATRLLGRDLEAPLLVSAMTGGAAEARTINHRLARAAAAHGIGMTLGSGRPLLRDPGLLDTYVGDDRPPLLLANLGAPQLLPDDGPEKAERLVELLRADGLSLHLNAVQEAIQPEGEPAWSGVAERISAVVERLAPLPVVVKEVGFGMDAEDVRLLAAAGVASVDVAGAGGTNWALIEGRREARAGRVASAFGAWGVPTAIAILEAAEAAPGLPLIASGGLHDGVEAATCLALGASAAGLARPLLLAAREDRADEAVGVLVEQLRVAVWATGAKSAAVLGPEHLRRIA